jgi:hypothetical protein
MRRMVKRDKMMSSGGGRESRDNLIERHAYRSLEPVIALMIIRCVE